MLLAAGHLLMDRYLVVRLAERGGMALLYEVRHKELDLPLALKVLMATPQTDPILTRYFQSEARALARLRHPGVPWLVDMGSIEGHPFLLMEWLEGEPLSHRMKRLGRLDLPVVLSICQQIGDVLSVAHGHGIVHRDLKPGNIFLCQRPGQPEVTKVLDFGIARVPSSTGNERPVTVPGTLLGTPEYMAPEQARGDVAAMGAHTDQYALAMLAYAMLSGQPAFVISGPSPAALVLHLAAVQNDPPPSPGEHVGTAVAQVLVKGLAKTPSDRFASVQEFVAALVEARTLDLKSSTRSGASAALVAPSPSAPEWVAKPPIARNRAPRTVFLLLGGIFVGGGGMYLLRGPTLPLAAQPPAIAAAAAPAPTERSPDLATAAAEDLMAAPEDLSPRVTDLRAPGDDLSAPVAEKNQPPRPPVFAKPATVRPVVAAPVHGFTVAGVGLTSAAKKIILDVVHRMDLWHPSCTIHLQPGRGLLIVPDNDSALTRRQAKDFEKQLGIAWFDQKPIPPTPTSVEIHCAEH